MSTELESQDSGQVEEGSVSFLDQAIGATKQAKEGEAKDLIANLTKQVMEGTVSWDKNLTNTISGAIKQIDEMISLQLAEIMHDEKFQKLEGSWRGMHHLVSNTETGTGMKIRMLNVSQKELFKDLDSAVEFDQSQVYKKIYEAQFGTAGADPYGVLLGDYEFSNSSEDIEALEKMSNVAASAFCPFVAAAGASMFGLDDFTELSQPRDIAGIFESQEYIKWRSFRESEDSRFVNLVMPRVLARQPYGASGKSVDAFNYEEFLDDPEGSENALKKNEKEADNNNFSWMNAAYAMGTTLTKAFAENGWCTAIRGAEGGGKVEGLPMHLFSTDDGDTDQTCPTEIGITDRREAELSGQGFLPLCHYKNTDYAVFFGGQTAQSPKKYSDPDATANASISARLPYIMATSRIAHYLKVMARDMVGSFQEASDVERDLNKWIGNYTNGNPEASPESKAKYPLREAKIEVKEIPGAPGSYNAVAHMRPWLQMEELTTSLRMVAKIGDK